MDGTGASGTFADPTAFHVLDLRTFAVTDTYTFLIDGTVVSTGSRPAGFGGIPTTLFGDGTPTGGNQIADFATVIYLQVVPEPASIILTSSSCLLMASGVWYYHRRLKAAFDQLECSE